MNLRVHLAFALCLFVGLSAVPAQLALKPDREPQLVFGGGARIVSAQWRNAGSTTCIGELSVRLNQASSAIAAPIGVVPWKKLVVLPGQTVLESATLAFPSVHAETRFVAQWITETRQVLGATEVWVYPTHLLKELRALAGEPGVLDPHNELKPLLQAAGVEFTDLEKSTLEDFGGKLAVIGPFKSRDPIGDGLAARLKALSKRGVAVVWLLPPSSQTERRRERLTPSFYMVRQGDCAVVVARFELTAMLADNPQSQLNLLELARLAVHPETPRLPD